MCGILFFEATGRLAAEQEGRRLGDRLVHRGPDASETQVVQCGNRTFVIAFHRLGIIAPASDAGMQPFRCAPAWRFACNGELYNYRDMAAERGMEVGASDVEVLCKSLARVSSSRQEILAVLDEADGDFAFVMLDADDGRVIAGRDPYGVRPMFIGREESGRIIALASEAKGIHDAPGVAKVEVFPPGHALVDGELVRYKKNTGHHRLVRGILSRAVSKRVAHSERPVGVLCSGGVDSALVTALAAREARKTGMPLRAFTIRFAEGASEDAFYARLLCERLGVELEEVTFDAAGVREAIEPVIRTLESCDVQTVRAAIPMYLLAKHIGTQTDVRVVLSGEGSDELFAGYRYFSLAPSVDEVAKESERLVGILHMFDLLRADRCFAAFGVEVRVPFLDRDLVDYVASLGSESRRDLMWRTDEKALLRDAFRGASDEIGRALSAIRILDRPKERFSDGCGFSYVPSLLAHLGGPDARTLEERQRAERHHYARVFEGIYGGDLKALVCERRLPEWAEKERAKATMGAVLGA